MKKIIFSVIIIIIMIIYSITLFSVESANRVNTNYVEYNCDVKILNLNTKINISKNDKNFASVSGNIFKLIEDPLTMYDAAGNKIAYAGDTYHFISQDSHGIYVDNQFKCDMVGKVDFIGESYEIYDNDEKLIAKMELNGANTKGILYDLNNNLLAEFNSGYFYYDFDIKIYDNCTLDHKTVLMLFCSYYSDYSADNG